MFLKNKVICMKKIIYIVFCLIYSIAVQAKEISIPEIDEEYNKKWERFQSFTSRGLNEFVADKAFLHEVRSVFYPFGGADILYPLKIFPNATKIVLAGLEMPGEVAYFEKKNISKIEASLPVVSLLKRSFFITDNMQKTLSRQDGVIECILVQLKLLGVEKINISNVRKPALGVKFSFMYNNIMRDIYYYQTNLVDKYLKQEFTNYLTENKIVEAVLLKSTSYTLHQGNFSKIREFIVNSANIIVQDDSGIPFKDLDESYNIKIYGKYNKPYGKEFAGYFQEALKERSASNQEKIPFCFGYGCNRQIATMIIAEREKV